MTYNVISGTDLNDCLWAASKLAKLAWCGKAYVYEYYGVYHVSRYEVDVTGYRLVAEVEENFVQPPSDCELPYQEVRDYLRNREAQYKDWTMIDSRILEVVREHLKVCLTINCDSAELNRTKVEFTVGLYIDEIMISESSDFIMVSN